MMAGDRLFVDLLPEGWVGLPPGLPQEAVDELARRAREAERRERERRQVVEKREPPAIRVRVGTQPTFTRYVFELPPSTPVTTDRTKDGLSLLFDAPLRFDLADARTSLPPSVAGIDVRDGVENLFRILGIASAHQRVDARHQEIDGRTIRLQELDDDLFFNGLCVLAGIDLAQFREQAV